MTDRRESGAQWTAIASEFRRTVMSVVKAAGRIGLTRNGCKFPECWSCGARCPTYNHLAVSGWVSRPLAGYPCEVEVYCRACFKRWGWGDGKREGP